MQLTDEQIAHLWDCSEREGETILDGYAREIRFARALLSASKPAAQTLVHHPDERVSMKASEYEALVVAAAPAQSAEPVDYDRVVSICDAHGIGLPVDCIEMVVEIILHAAPQPSPTAVVLGVGRDQDAVTREQVVSWAKLAGVRNFTETSLGILGDFAVFARQARAASPQPVEQTRALTPDAAFRAAQRVYNETGNFSMPEAQILLTGSEIVRLFNLLVQDYAARPAAERQND